MRDILFRGQTRRKGEYIVNMAGDKCESHWVYGGIFPQNKDGDFAIIYQQEPEIRKFTVYADTVGQYTGLTDKNGVKIFEGDIVRYDVNYHDMVISYDVENWGGWLYEDMDDNMQAYSIYEFCLKDIAVVGNIHDNPEILKGGEDNG